MGKFEDAFQSLAYQKLEDLKLAEHIVHFSAQSKGEKWEIVFALATVLVPDRVILSFVDSLSAFVTEYTGDILSIRLTNYRKDNTPVDIARIPPMELTMWTPYNNGNKYVPDEGFNNEFNLKLRIIKS